MSFNPELEGSSASAIIPLFFTIEALEAEELELRRASLALTLLYLASKSLVGLSSDHSDTMTASCILFIIKTILKVLDDREREEIVDRGTGYLTNVQNQRQNRQNRAQEWKERKKTSPTVQSDFIGLARNPLTWAGPAHAAQKEQELLEQEQGIEEKQELLTEEHASNPSEPSPVSYFYNADYDNISTPSTTYTIHLTKSATIIPNPFEPTRRIYHNHDIFYDGDDDEELFPDEVKRIQQILEKTSFDAITPDFSITDSLSMGTSIVALFQKRNQTNEYDVPVNDESSLIFTTFLNPLFDCNNDFTSSDDKSLSNEDVPMENFKIYSNPLFDDEEIISTKIEEAKFDLEEEIYLVENLSYDNSSPRPPEELNAEIADMILKSLSPSPILVKDNDSHMTEIKLFLGTDDLMPPGIENDDYDSEGDIYFLEELLSNDPLPLPEHESSNFDHHDDPSFPRPPPEPPDVEVFFDFKPDTGVLTTKVVNGISEHYVLMPNILPTLPTLDPDLNFTPSHDSLGSRNKIFNPGIFIKVHSERLLSREEFSISFIHDPLYPVFDTLLPFSSENEDKVFMIPYGEIKVHIEVLLVLWGNRLPIPDGSLLLFSLDGDDDDNDYDKESVISTNIDIFETPLSIVITTSPPILPIEDPGDSLIMGNEELNTLLEKEWDECIKYSVEDLVPIPSESEDTPGSESLCILPSCDDFSPIDVIEEKAVTFSNPLFISNDDFISSNDESLSDEDVQEDNVKIYSNPPFEFDDEYISSDVNPFFDEVLENIESKDSYDSNLDESTFLVTPLSDSNEDEYFTPGDDVELLLHHDPSIPNMSVASILKGFIDEPHFEENDELFDLEPKNDDWKKILYDAQINDLMSEDKVFDPEIHDQNFSPTYVSLPFEDRHYFLFTYVVRILLLYFTYPVVSPILISSESEDTIFDHGISAFYFSHRNGTLICFNVHPNILNESPMEICSSTLFTPNIMMIWGELS
nr:hypothetical protein [Tanacetum cinerariifolium]GEV36918.1 hypothetical protein [Tanacetum cinerariifolium]